MEAFITRQCSSNKLEYEVGYFQSDLLRERTTVCMLGLCHNRALEWLQYNPSRWSPDMHEIGFIFAFQVNIVWLFLQSHLCAEFICCRSLTIVTNWRNSTLGHFKRATTSLSIVYQENHYKIDRMSRTATCYAALFPKIWFSSLNSYLEVLGLFSPNHHAK